MSDQLCPFCAIGFVLPSGRCDHCNRDVTAANAEFERLLAEGDREMKPLLDAIQDSTRLTAEDFNITINTRD